MPLVTLAIVNGALAIAVVAALVYVCSIPFRIDHAKPRPRFATERPGTETGYKRRAA